MFDWVYMKLQLFRTRFCTQHVNTYVRVHVRCMDEKEAANGST